MEYNNITQTGIKGLKGIRGNDLYNDISDDELLNLVNNAKASNYNAMHGHTGYDALYNPLLTTPKVLDPNTLLGLLGRSSYDDITVNPSPEEIGDRRALRQPKLLQLGAGVLKGTALAGTTFLDGTLGLLYGIGSAVDTWIDGGSFSEGAGEIFNNKLSKGLRAVNDYMEEALPVYRTLDEIENPMALRNLFSMSTIADDFIKNMGFTVGAFYSGNAYLSALKGLNGLVKAKQLSSTAAKIIGSTLSGFNEGRIEAGHLFDETYKEESKGIDEMFDVLPQVLLSDLPINNPDLNALKEKYKPLYDEIMALPDKLILGPEGIAINPKYELLRLLLKALEADKQKLKEDAKRRATNAGLMDLMFNTAYLPLTDYYTYGKLYTRGFNTKKDLANKVGKSIDNAVEQAAKEDIFGSRIVKNAAGKYEFNLVSTGKAALRGAKIFGIEGSEEMNQAGFASLSTNYFSPDSPDAYYLALANDEYEMKTKDFMTSLNQALKDSWGKEETYKEFLIGGLNGIIGMPTFGKVNNSDHNTWLGRGKMIGMSGGIFGEISNNAYYNKQAQAATDAMNNFVDKVNNAKMFFTRSLSFTDAMDGYSEANDKFEFENAKDNDTFNIIDAYGRTGRIQDLYDLVNQDFEDLSEERLKEIAEDTESSTNEWRNIDGTLMSDSEEGRAEMIRKLEDKRKAIIEGIKSYEESLLGVRSISNNSLTEDLNAELAWLNWKLNRFTDRFNSIKEEHQDFIDKLEQATLAFLKGRGLGILTLNEEDIYPYKAVTNEETGEIEYVEKTQEEKDYEINAGQNMKKSMEVTSQFLDMLSTAKSPLQLAYFVKNNPLITQFIDDIGFDLLEDIVPITYDEYKEGMAALKDVAKIATAHKSFSDRYREFTDNPSKVIQNRLKIEAEKQKVDKVRGRKNIADEVKNTSVGDLARGDSEGDLNLDDLMSQMKEKQESEELNSLEENPYKENPYKEELDKLEEAKNLNLTYTNLVNSIKQDDSLSEQLVQDALDLVNAAYQLAESVDDITDIDMEAYNDARNLQLNGNTDDEVLERLDEANNLIHQKTQELDLKRQASQDMPSSSDTFVEPINRGTTNSRDPQDIPETELERIAREKKEREESLKRKDLLDAISQTWNRLISEAFWNATPDYLNIMEENEGSLKAMKALVDDAINNGLSTTQTFMLLYKEPYFENLKNIAKGELLNAITLYISYRRNTQKNSSNEVSQNSLNQELQKETYEDRGIPTPDTSSQTKASALKFENEELPTNFGKKQYIAPSLRKSIPNRDGSISNYEDSDIAKLRYTETTLNRMKVIRKFLEERNAFENVDNNAVKVGDKLSLVVYPEVIDATGELIIFMQTSDGKVVGDLPSRLYSTTKDYVGLLDLISDIEKDYAEWIKNEDNKNKLFIYEKFKPTVTLNLIGVVLYTKEDKSLNEIFGDKLQLALCLTENGQPRMLYEGGKTKGSRNSLNKDNKVMLPLNPTPGMPYVLVESSDPNRKYVPVPFRMARYDGNTNTMLGKAIHSVIKDILTENVPSETLKNSLLDLIALDDIWLEINEGNITFRIKKQGATLFETIIDNEPRTTDLEVRIRESLINNPYLVSRKYINGNYEYFENGIPIKVKYNQMIGEIATANIGATHTQGDWFITESAIGTTNKIASSRNNPNHHAAITNFVFNGVSYTITKEGPTGVDNWIVKDDKGDIINDENLRAYGYGVYKGYSLDKQYNVPWSVTIDRNGEAVSTSVYSPKTNKYILPPVTSSSFEEAMALLKGERNVGVWELEQQRRAALNSTGTKKRDIEVAEAVRLDKRDKYREGTPDVGNIFGNPDEWRNSVEDMHLDVINAAIQDAVNERKAKRGLLFPEKTPKQYWAEVFAEMEKNVPKLTEADKAIAQAVFEDRISKYREADLLALNKVLESMDVTPTYSEETYNGQPHLVITIPFEGATKNSNEVEVPTYKLGDILNIQGLLWKVYSIEDNGVITLISPTFAGTMLKFNSWEDLNNSNPTIATEEEILKAQQEVAEVILKPITQEEVQQVTPIDSKFNISRASYAPTLLKDVANVVSNSKELNKVLVSKGGYNIFQMDSAGRTFVIANIDGVIIPFYQSSHGTDGKIKGNWYPFFGMTGNWLVKGNVDLNGLMNYYSEIDRVTKLLNDNLHLDATKSAKKIAEEIPEFKAYTFLDRFPALEEISPNARGITPIYGTTRKNGVTVRKSPYKWADALYVEEITGIDASNVVNDSSSGEGWVSGKEHINQILDSIRTLKFIQQVVDNFAEYFKGEGKTIQDDFPGFNEQIASKFENYIMGSGEFTEDDAIEFLNEIERIENAKVTGTKNPNPEIDQLTPAELKQKAEDLGLLGTNDRILVWDFLTPELQNVLINSPLAESKITMLTHAYIDEEEGFDTSMLGNKSIDDFLSSKPKFLESFVKEEPIWNEQKERTWLERALPLFNRDERLLIIEILKTIDGQDAYGLFWNDTITIAKNAVRGTLYHEAFHGVVNTLLTDQEYKDLFDAAIEQYGNLDIDILEENLAEDFRRYTKLLEKPIIGTIVKIFRKLKHLILKLSGNEPYINKLFYDINRGKFATRGIQESNTLKYSTLAINRFQSILDSTVNNIRVYPLYNDYRRKDSIITLNKGWKRWKNKMESLHNVTIKGYRNNDTNKWIIASVTPNNPKYLRVNLDLNQTMVDDLLVFLDNFNIKINDIKEDYTGELPLFDALNRVINPQTSSDIPKGVGYAIAFMMLHHPEIEEIITLRSNIGLLKGFKRSIKVRGKYDVNTKNLKQIRKNKELFDSYLHEIGDNIADELNKLYNGKPINTEESFLQKLWNIITEFFDKMTHDNKIYYSVLSSYTKHIANAIKLNDATIILSTDNKPETTSEANLVDIGLALIDYPYENSIIRKLNSEGIAVAGGASIAISGTLYRPSENPLHDLDFNAGDITKEELENILSRQGFNFMHFNTINDGEGKVTETYLIVDEPFEVKRISPEISANGIYSTKTGELIGSYSNGKKNVEFISHNNHKGKFLDFFIGKNNKPYPNFTTNINGTDYLVASPLNAFKAKVEWARVKDIWDYNRFVPFNKEVSRTFVPNEELKERINKASIIWGHPALGKTTYLKENNDILEWDDLINPERFEFIRSLIDPEKIMDTSSREYRQLQSDYMASWKNHPKYVEFLTEKWNWLKQKAKQENKKIMASPTPLLELFKDDFDLYIILNQKDFLTRNMSRGGSLLGSLGWEQGIYDILSKVDLSKIARTESYLSNIMLEPNILQKSKDKLMFGFLTSELKSFILKRASIKEYNDMSDNMKEVFLHCK